MNKVVAMNCGGLSRLQRCCLALAWADPNLTVSPWMVKVEFYGFIPARRGRCSRSSRFDRQKIGVARYVAAGAAITVSFQRLVARSLATDAGYGSIRITRSGVIAAITISQGENKE